MNNFRQQRHKRIRSKVKGTLERPRASVYRSLTGISVQLVDDGAGNTLAAVSGKKPEAVGKEIAEVAKTKGIDKIVFDRGGWIYTGRVKILAEAMREGGLKF